MSNDYTPYTGRTDQVRAHRPDEPRDAVGPSEAGTERARSQLLELDAAELREALDQVDRERGPYRTFPAGALLAVPDGAPGPERNDAPATAYARALRLWGVAHVKHTRDVITIGPIGSRDDTLIFWRSGRRVATGCFEGRLDDFADAVERDYAARLENFGEDARDDMMRHRAAYRAAIAFFRAL